MSVDTYKQLKKITCQELNVHEVIEELGSSDRGDVSIHFWTSLGFYDKPDELWLQVGSEKWEGSPTLEKIIAAM